MRPLFLLAAFSIAAANAQAQSVPRKQLVQEIRLDGTSEDFPAIDRVAIGPHGQIAVWVHQDQSLRLYDSSGAKVASFGRKGGGPGESRVVNALGFKSDTVWHYDTGLKRLTFISPEGKLLRNEVLPPWMNRGGSLDSSANPVGEMYGFSPVMITPSGRMVGYAFEVIGRGDDGRVKTQQSFMLANADGSDRKKIGEQVFPPAPTQKTIQIDEKHSATAGVPFVAYPSIRYTTDGTRFGVVLHTFTDKGGTYRVAVVRTTGDTVFARVYPFVGTPIPAAVRDSAIDAVMRAKYYEPKVNAQLRDLVRPLTPKVYRPVNTLVMGRDNTTWLVMRPDGLTKEIVALNAKGDPILATRIAANAELMDGSLTRIWVVEKDADDLPSLVRYRLR